MQGAGHAGCWACRVLGMQGAGHAGCFTDGVIID